MSACLALTACASSQPASRRKLTAQLRELGLTPADIDFLSFSHMHFDHAGNAHLFAGATWRVEADERAAAFSDAAHKRGDFAATGPGIPCCS